MRQFYVEALGGKSGPRYANPQTGFRSYFVAFGDCRLELMWQEGPGRREPKGEGLGYAHVAMSAGGRDEVDVRIPEDRDHRFRGKVISDSEIPIRGSGDRDR